MEPIASPRETHEAMQAGLLREGSEALEIDVWKYSQTLLTASKIYFQHACGTIRFHRMMHRVKQNMKLWKRHAHLRANRQNRLANFCGLDSVDAAFISHSAVLPFFFTCR